MNIYAPYTYLIGWSHLKKYYYGVRYANRCCPNDLWVTYFSSSKKVKQYRTIYGEPDIVQVRKTFNTVNEARIWENKVLRRLKVTKSDIWLNETNNISFSYEVSVNASQKASLLTKGVPLTNDHKRKISMALKGKLRDPQIAIKTQETKKIKKANDINYTGGPHKGRIFSEEHKKKLSEAKKGKPGRVQSEEERKKRSISMKGNKHGFRTVLGVSCPF